MEGVLSQAAWWGVAGREQRLASGPGQPWVFTGLSPGLAGFSACPMCSLGEGRGMGSFRACCRLGRSSEFGVLV